MLTMKKACLILIFVINATVALSTVDYDWETFKTKFNKNYSPEEDIQRRIIFNTNKVMIEEHNKKFEEGKVTFTMGINKFADMLPEELSHLRGYKQKDAEQSRIMTNLLFNPKEGATYPDTVDWREKGYVTPVKDQGHCGSCWAFSATGALEGQNFAKTGKLVSLSEQNFVDCDPFDWGCDGGFLEHAFYYVKWNDGIDTEKNYPYHAKEEECKYDPKDVGGHCSGIMEVGYRSEENLLAAVATVGPISTGIDASLTEFHFYTSGVFYNKNCSDSFLDHAVLVVGYGTYNGEDYWLVKNSWGASWGDEGYIMMARNKDNHCGIATSPCYPLVD